jgi:hypothetical protein
MNYTNEKLDVDKQYEDLWEVRNQLSSRKKLDMVLRLYTVFGMVIALVGVAYFILTTLNIHLTLPQTIALLTAGIGLLLAATSRALLVLRRANYAERIYDINTQRNDADFIRKWAQFESISKEKLKKGHEDFNKYSIRDVITRLREDGTLTENDLRLLEEAIQARNSIVHHGDSLSADRARRFVELLTDIIQKLAI